MTYYSQFRHIVLVPLWFSPIKPLQFREKSILETVFRTLAKRMQEENARKLF